MRHHSRCYKSRGGEEECDQKSRKACEKDGRKIWVVKSASKAQSLKAQKPTTDRWPI